MTSIEIVGHESDAREYQEQSNEFSVHFRIFTNDPKRLLKIQNELVEKIDLVLKTSFS